MFKPSKSVLPYGAVAIATGILMLAAPRAAHAIAATLVQVANTVSNPAIAQSPNSQAAQLVELSTVFQNPNSSFIPFSSVTGNSDLPNYVVPANQSLVITAVDLSAVGTCSGSTQARLASPGQEKIWFLTFGATTHFDYPSGIVLPPSSSPLAFLVNASNGCTLYFDMHGYLTSN
jgi:hypothetical protein